MGLFDSLVNAGKKAHRLASITIIYEMDYIIIEND